MNCKNCGNYVPEGAFTCPSCGVEVEAAPPAAQPEYAPPPPQYGPPPPPQYGPPPPPPPYPQPPVGAEQKSKLTAGLLGIFLGVVGAGRFYLGYTGLAVAQLLVSIFTCGIGSLWGLVDGIMILTGSVKTDAHGVPLKD